ncbi:MAG: Gfo/Idh/MocA family oxidoreductase [Actinomycetaceae bacterium]|nr:Gfo/Idh/MocA family oxidoreductase [Actinomycetaceae bacterium]
MSSTQLRSEEQGFIHLGIIGAGRSARRMVRESWRVSGIKLSGCYSPVGDDARVLTQELDLPDPFPSVEDLIDSCDAVYIASPHGTHYDYARAAIVAGKHVLCESPMVLRGSDARELYALARDHKVVLLEGAKTAFFTGFRRMLELVRSGVIGQIRGVDATFTKLVHQGREVEGPDGGAISEMGTYPIMAILKVLGLKYESVNVDSFHDKDTGIDTFSRIYLTYPHAIATATMGLGVKSEGDLVISGTIGYIYVPAPWWLTDSFEVRYEDIRQNRRYFYPYEDSGLRYELAEFAKMIHSGALETYKWRPEESITTAELIERARTSSIEHASH